MIWYLVHWIITIIIIYVLGNIREKQKIIMFEGVGWYEYLFDLIRNAEKRKDECDAV